MTGRAECLQRRAFFILLLVACSAFAQDRFVYPRPDPARIVAKKDNVLRGDLKFDLYRPAGNDVVPVVIFANVGSPAYTSWPVYIGWGEASAGAGLAGVVYQASPKDAIGDFDALIAVLRQRAGELRIDPTRVIVWSSSSNVQIGLPVAMDRKRDYVRGAVVYYGAADVPEIRQDLPLYFVRAGLDETWLNTRIDALIGRALAANAPWTIESNGSGVHGFDIWNDNDVSREIISRTLAFMKTAVRLSSTYAALGDRAAVGATYARGEWQKAIDGYRRLLAADATDPEAHRRLGIALLETKQYPESLRELERAWDLGRRGARDTGYPAAQAAAGARNIERTVHWLNVILSTRFGPPLDELRTSEAFAAVRDEREFKELLEKFEK